jgi:hypothetical protein
MSDSITEPSIVMYNNNYLIYNNNPILFQNNQYYCINLLEIQKIMSGNLSNSNDYLKKLYIKNINFNDTNSTVAQISKENNINLSVKNITDEPNNIFCNNKLKEINIDIVNYGKTITDENILKFYNNLDDDNKKKYFISKYINILTNKILNKMEGLKKDSEDFKIIKENIKELINYKDFFISIDNNTECNNLDGKKIGGIVLLIIGIIGIIGIGIVKIILKFNLEKIYLYGSIAFFSILFIIGILLLNKVF